MVYVHVPFCRSFCVYCGFYSESTCSEKEYGRYLECLLAEIEDRRAEIESTLGVNTLYIGGGTPSVVPLAFLKRIADALPYGPFEEFTVEVNPDDIARRGVEYVKGLKALGVNRISIGVQSLDDGILRWMGRRHDADGARNAFRILREGGIDNVSVDLICGISHLPDSVFSGTLREIVQWRPEHVSIYQLSVEEGSALAEKVGKGLYSEADEELFRRQYLLACRMLREAGYDHYEISNWALPGRRAVHNPAYWKRLPYVGLGPAAHSLVEKGGVWKRLWNSESIGDWEQSGEALGAGEVREERIMLGLRTSEGWAGIRLSEEEWLVSDSIIADIAGAEPKLMGVLNLTPDSYFESSRCEAPDASGRIAEMVACGAEIIDIGAVSTRPGAPDVLLETEWERLEPVLRSIAGGHPGYEVSLDTFRSEIVRRAYGILGPGFIVNDISAGEDDPEMLRTVGGFGLKYIAMHKRGNPRTMDSMAVYPDGVMPELIRYFREFDRKAREAGIRDWILDPGLGFAKDDAGNWEILERLGELCVFGRPILVSAADKRFTQRIPETVAAAFPDAVPSGNSLAHRLALLGGASVFRVHI